MNPRLARVLNSLILVLAVFVVGYAVYGPRDPEVEAYWEAEYAKLKTALEEPLQDNETDPDEPYSGYQYVSASDAEMNAAIERARRELPRFVAMLDDPAAAELQLRLKAGFPVRRGALEHIWMGQVRFDGSRFSARIANDPVDHKDLRYGDRVSVEPDAVTDWMYIENGRLVGGYTVRVLRARLPPEQRQRMDAALAAVVE